MIFISLKKMDTDFQFISSWEANFSFMEKPKKNTSKNNYMKIMLDQTYSFLMI